MKKLPKISESVQQYLNTKEYNNTSELFRIKITSKNEPHSRAGIAFLNELIIEEKIDGQWKEKYSTGMIEYRNAFNSKCDNWDLSIHDPTILKVNKDRKMKDMITYGVRTGAGNIKIYQFSSNNYRPILIVSFNIKGYEKVMGENGHA